MSKFICIVPNTFTLAQRVNILNKFMTFGSLNVVIVHEDAAGDVIYESVGANVSLKILKNPKHCQPLFPDKLKELRGLNSTVAIHDQPPSVIIGQGSVHGQMFNFLDALSKVLNIKFKLHVLPDY
ncbi:hypothetical protein ACKWTF_015832 [Chironomus riparius]